MSFTCSVCLELLSNAADINSNQSTQRASPNNNNNDNDILATTCGHLYHAVCLRDWFHSQANRRDCPTCRRAVNEQQCVKIYLPTSGDGEIGGGPSKLSKLKGEIERLEGDLKTAYSDLDKERAIQRELRFELNAKNAELDSVKAVLIEQREEFNGAESNYKKQIKILKEENRTLEEQISVHEHKLTAKQYQWQERRKEHDSSTKSLEKELQECRFKLVEKQEELERVRKTAYEESAGIIESLTTSREILREELRALQLKHSGNTHCARAVGVQTEVIYANQVSAMKNSAFKPWNGENSEVRIML